MSKDKREGWLAELKAGDTVIVTDWYRDFIRKVDRITPSGRIIIGELKFDNTGYRVGNHYFDKYHLVEATKIRNG
jgi:hypothetical protein